MIDHQGPDPLRWKALTVVCAAFFMTVLDVSIVNVALPSIKRSLDVTDVTVQWVLIAYTITFGDRERSGLLAVRKHGGERVDWDLETLLSEFGELATI